MVGQHGRKLKATLVVLTIELTIWKILFFVTFVEVLVILPDILVQLPKQ